MLKIIDDDDDDDNDDDNEISTVKVATMEVATVSGTIKFGTWYPRQWRFASAKSSINGDFFSLT